MVYWGTTTGGQKDPIFHGGVPDGRILELDARNARLLGYDTELAASGGIRSSPIKRHSDDLVDELEDNRYFVVLIAYDFQQLWKEKKRHLLWETRFSMREQRNDFGQVLPEMAQDASKYFGENLERLVHKPFNEGNIKLGELKILDVVPDKPAPVPPPPPDDVR